MISTLDPGSHRIHKTAMPPRAVAYLIANLSLKPSKVSIVINHVISPIQLRSPGPGGSSDLPTTARIGAQEKFRISARATTNSDKRPGRHSNVRLQVDSHQYIGQILTVWVPYTYRAIGAVCVIVPGGLYLLSSGHEDVKHNDHQAQKSLHTPHTIVEGKHSGSGGSFGGKLKGIDEVVTTKHEDVKSDLPHDAPNHPVNREKVSNARDLLPHERRYSNKSLDRKNHAIEAANQEDGSDEVDMTGSRGRLLSLEMGIAVEQNRVVASKE